ncbi:hypothetical protein NHQ30_001377 [Ciborinia camelliae]|nr:hypothetical protein NHQ30_001377 [Ciborinia camelliae]
MVWEIEEQRKDNEEALARRVSSTRGASHTLRDANMKKVFTYNFALSDIEARQKSEQFAGSISENLTYLQQQCDRNGNSIIKKWKKKSCGKREALLRDINPNLYQHQWPDAHLEKAFDDSLRSAGDIDIDITDGWHMRKHRTVCLLPYLTVEGLIQDPMKFLGLLYNRTKYTPEQWAPYDNSLLEKHWHMGSLALHYNDHSIVMSGPRYGTLIHWNKAEAHRWTSIGFPRAILILEAQAYLLSFLRSMVERILGSSNNLLMESQPTMFDEILDHGSTTSKGPSGHPLELSSSYLNQPFSAPPAFSIDSLLNIAKARQALQGDHLWLLQTDPLYARRHINLAMTSNLGVTFEPHHQYILASSVTIIQDAVIFWSWGWIVDELENLKELQISLNESLDPQKPLSKAYDAALGSLEELLLNQLDRRLNYLKILLPMHFRDVHKITTVSDHRGTFFRSLPNSCPDFTRDRLEFCLSILHLATCREAKNMKELTRLDEVLYTALSSMAAMTQMLDMVRFHRPRSKKREFENITSETARGWRYIEKHLEDQYESRSFDFENIDHRKLSPWENQTQKIKAEKLLADATKKFVETPKPRGTRLSQQWIDADNQQRKALGRLWAQVRAHHEQTLRRLGFHQKDIDHDLTVLSADSTPEHVKSIENRNSEILTEIASRHSKKFASLIASNQKQWGPEQPEKLTPPTRSKVKTRKLPTSDIKEELPLRVPVGVEMTGTTPLEVPSPSVRVGKNSYAIFQTMFPSRNFEERTKTVPWDSFVNAMAEVGFVASHSAGGSAVQFEPDATSPWFGQGKIVFHKPHPERIVDAVMLSAMGKRMERWFGWNDETFEVAKK